MAEGALTAPTPSQSAGWGSEGRGTGGGRVSGGLDPKGPGQGKPKGSGPVPVQPQPGTEGASHSPAEPVASRQAKAPGTHALRAAENCSPSTQEPARSMPITEAACSRLCCLRTRKGRPRAAAGPTGRLLPGTANAGLNTKHGGRLSTHTYSCEGWDSWKATCRRKSAPLSHHTRKTLRMDQPQRKSEN